MPKPKPSQRRTAEKLSVVDVDEAAEIEAIVVRLKSVFGIPPRVYAPLLSVFAVVLVLTATFVLPGVLVPRVFLEIRSVPSGASVYVNDRWIGSTPYRGWRPSGLFEIVVRKHHYDDFGVQFTAAPQRLGAHLLPNPLAVEAVLVPTDVAAQVDDAARAFAQWAVVGVPTATYQFAPVLAQVGADVQALAPQFRAAAGTARARFASLLPQLLGHTASVELTADLVRGWSRVNAASQVFSPLVISHDVSFLIQVVESAWSLDSWVAVSGFEAMIAHGRQLTLTGSGAPGVTSSDRRSLQDRPDQVDSVDGAAVSATAAWRDTQAVRRDAELAAFYEQHPSGIAYDTQAFGNAAAPTITVHGVPFVFVPATRFVSGVDDQSARFAPRDPFRRAAIADVGPFWVQSGEVTAALFAEFQRHAGHTSEHPVADGDLPAAGITWVQAQEFVRWFSELARSSDAAGELAAALGGVEPRAAGSPATLIADLPSEDEWELAARLNTATGTGESARPIGGMVPFDQQVAGAWGIRGLMGSLWEWTASAYTPIGRMILPPQRVTTATAEAVVRGGSWINPVGSVEIASRGGFLVDQPNEYVGLRMVIRRR